MKLRTNKDWAKRLHTRNRILLARHLTHHGPGEGHASALASDSFKTLRSDSLRGPDPQLVRASSVPRKQGKFLRVGSAQGVGGVQEKGEAKKKKHKK